MKKSDVTYRFALLRYFRGRHWSRFQIYDAVTRRAHDRAQYTPAQRRALCEWLNERAARYPINPKLSPPLRYSR